MREAPLLVASLVLVAAVPAGAGAEAPDYLAHVEAALAALDRGELPDRSHVLTVGASGASERTATAEDARRVLEAAREALLASRTTAGDPPALVRDVGFGTFAAPLPHGMCEAVTTWLIAFSPDEIEPMMTYRIGSNALYGGECGGDHGPFAEVLLDARPALASCAACAQSSAQVWAHAPPGSTHVNDFVQVHHRGYGLAYDHQLCWFGGPCIRYVDFYGSVATAELLAEPVHLPLPPTHVP